MNQSPPPTEQGSDTSIREGDSPSPPSSSNPRRYHSFLSAYTGAPVPSYTVSTFTRAQVQVGGGGKEVTASQRLLRGTVVAIEGDKCFRILKALSSAAGAKRGRDGRRTEGVTNCAMSALHHQLPTGERITLRIIITTTQMRSRDTLVLCPHSVLRCVDEPAWYKEVFNQPLPDATPIPHWPREVPYYHGIGDATRSTAHPPRVGFPYSLLSLQPSATLGAGEMEVVATAPIPSGTCFEYTGELADVDSSTPSDGVYSFQLRDHQTVEGSGITRYINHRFRFNPFGNLQFSQACLPNTTDSKKRLHDGDSRMIVIPFFVTTRDVHRGEQLLATSYGDVYDAQLERDIFRPDTTNPLHNIIPCGLTPVLDHAGAYRWAVGIGDIVHVPQLSSTDIGLLSTPLSSTTAPSYGLMVVEDINEAASMVLLRPMKDALASSTLARRPVFEPNPPARTVMCHISHLSLLAPHTDFEPSPAQGPIQSISLTKSTMEALAPLHPTRTTNGLLCGSYWSMVSRH